MTWRPAVCAGARDVGIAHVRGHIAEPGQMRGLWSRVQYPRPFHGPVPRAVGLHQRGSCAAEVHCARDPGWSERLQV